MIGITGLRERERVECSLNRLNRGGREYSQSSNSSLVSVTAKACVSKIPFLLLQMYASLASLLFAPPAPLAIQRNPFDTAQT